jgi:putative ABC transport system permease protein
MNGFRVALRQVVRYPAFSAVVVATLALGVGASTLIFGVVNAVLLQPLPYPDPDRIVRVREITEQGGRPTLSDANFLDLKEQSRSFAAFAQYDSGIESVAGGSEPARVGVSNVSREFFDVLGVQPVLGRNFVPEELAPGAAAAALISYRYWQRYLGGAADFASQSLRWGDRVYSIIGVMPPGFDYPDGADAWAARELWPVLGRRAHNYQAIGRLADGVPLEKAAEELGTIARRLKVEFGDDTDMSDVFVVPLHEYVVGNVRPALLILSAAAALLLLVASTNALSMLLARAAARSEELAVRAALGAGRWRIARQFFAEAGLLCGAGAALGLLTASWGARLIVALDPSVLPRAAEVRVSWTVVAFAFGVAVVIAACLSLAMVWHSFDDATPLRASTRAVAGGRRSSLRDGLVAAQVAIALILSVGAALLARSFVQVTNVDPGFRTDGAVLMNLAMTWPGQDPELRARLARFYDALFDRLRELPGVEAVGGVSVPPLRGGGASGEYVEQRTLDEVEDFDDLRALVQDSARTGFADFQVASEDYFTAMGIPLLRGRTFSRSDGPGAPHVALVSRSLAESQWPGQDPIGKLVQFGGMDGDLTPFRIIGIVGDVRDYGLESAARPAFYGYYRQRQWHFASAWVVLRAPSAEQLVPAVRAIVRELDPDLPPEFMGSEELVSGALAPRRFNLTMLATFGGAALLLALAGIYGAIAFNVAQRTREIGVRIALGAQRRRVIALVLRRSLVLAGVGIAVGLAIALGASRLVASLLFGVAPHDPVSYFVAAAVLLLAALGAAWLPAFRAARIDPVSALRSE